jgi:hypothetical protein
LGKPGGYVGRDFGELSRVAVLESWSSGVMEWRRIGVMGCVPCTNRAGGDIRSCRYEFKQRFSARPFSGNIQKIVIHRFTAIWFEAVYRAFAVGLGDNYDPLRRGKMTSKMP